MRTPGIRITKCGGRCRGESPPQTLRLPLSAFTLLEVILALMILALLTGAVYGIAAAATEATKATMAEQVSVRRLEAFLTVTRNAFLNLPREGRVYLKIAKSSTGAPIPELTFEESPGVFGIPSLGGGLLLLAARPRADGSRTMSLLVVPRDLPPSDLDRLKSGGAWIPLLPRVEKVKWSFLQNGEWKEEWPPEAGRPLVARLQMDSLDMGASAIDVQFWIPPLAAVPVAPPVPDVSPAPSASPQPSPKTR